MPSFVGKLAGESRVNDNSDMATAISFANQFLLAMPSMDDPNFAHSVTYICEHSEDGALGIVINRPSEVPLGEMFDQLEVVHDDVDIANTPICHGGPVNPERGFVLHEPLGDWEATLPISDTINLTSSRDVLGAIAQGKGPNRYLVALGYAGWEAGQLESEVVANAWLTVPADSAILFDLPYKDRWQAAAAQLGFDPNQLASGAGHG